MKIQESAENYLETILILSEKKDCVRSIDVAMELGYTKPSISRAMKLLRENSYVSVDEAGYITLTNSGMEIARRIYERHTFLAAFLREIGVEARTAAEDACRIEHVISQQTFDCLRAYIGGLR